MSQPIQTGPLDDETLAVMDRCRAWLNEVVSGGSPFGDGDAMPAGERVAALQAIIDGGGVTAEDEGSIFAVGVGLGDVLCEVLTGQWLNLALGEDAGEPGVQVDGRPIYLSPISMIAKRVVAGERIDVQELIVGLAQSVGEMLDSGDYERPM